MVCCTCVVFTIHIQAVWYTKPKAEFGGYHDESQLQLLGTTASMIDWFVCPSLVDVVNFVCSDGDFEDDEDEDHDDYGDDCNIEISTCRH